MPLSEIPLSQKIQNLLAQYESSKLVLLGAAKKVERVVAVSKTPWPTNPKPWPTKRPIKRRSTPRPTKREEAAVESWGEFERQDEMHAMTWETLLLNCDRLAGLHPNVGNILGLRESPVDVRFTKCTLRFAVSPRDISGFVPKIETAMGVLSQTPAAAADVPSQANWPTITQAAKVAKVGKGTISHAADGGRLTDNGKTGRDRRIDTASLLEWMENRREPSKPDDPDAIEQGIAAAQKAKEAKLNPREQNNKYWRDKVAAGTL